MIAALLLMFSNPAYAQSLDVTVIGHQERSGTYTYVVPGYSSVNSNSSVNCFGNKATANCSGVSQSNGFSTPASVGSYEVTGATLSLQLPDGRIVVVNCGKKINLGFGTNFYRSCRVPLVSKIHAIFRRDKAKLEWPVSLDGKKMAKETYKIVAILDKPQGRPAPSNGQREPPQLSSRRYPTRANQARADQ